MIGFYIGPLSPFNRHNCLYLLHPRTNEHLKLKHFHTLKRIQVKCLSLNDNGKRMKKIAYIIIGLTAVIAACGKKSTPKPTPVLSLSGKYVLYLNSDTLYKNSNIANGISEIINQNAGGDTAYINPATPQLVVQPNPIVGYDPVKAMRDTLTFSSATDGEEKTSLGAYAFAYSLQTGLFYDFINDPTISEKIIALSSTKVKLIITQKNGNTITGTRGNYYSKVN